MQNWAMERIADQHRHEMAGRLTTKAEAVDELMADVPQDPPMFQQPNRPQQEATRRTAAERPLGRRAAATHVGDWLIRAGTRLGGATVHASRS